MKPEDSWSERSHDPAPDGTVAHPAAAGLWEQLLSRGNLAEALRRVEQNAGAPGIDGMSTRELRPWLKEHWSEVRSALEELDEWLRRRLRQVRWKEWKRPSARRRSLIALDIPPHNAREWAYARKGYWRIAGSAPLQRSLTNAYWTSHGLHGFTDPYHRFRDATRTARCGPARRVVWEGPGRARPLPDCHSNRRTWGLPQLRERRPRSRASRRSAPVGSGSSARLLHEIITRGGSCFEP